MVHGTVGKVPRVALSRALRSAWPGASQLLPEPARLHRPTSFLGALPIGTARVHALPVRLSATSVAPGDMSIWGRRRESGRWDTCPHAPVRRKCAALPRA